MASISAQDVNALRKKTGAGMMDCKKALVEADGDMEAAVDILRKKGQKVAAKRGDNDASEGLVVAKTTGDHKKGILVTLNCETDFVAKNDEFQSFVNEIVDKALDSSAGSIEDVKALDFGGGLSVAEKITEQIGVIGEKLELSNYEVVNADFVQAYNHPGNQLATVVGFNKPMDEESARQVAMQVAAMAPIAVDEEGVDQDTINREIEVGKDLAIQEGKPADLAEKIAQGRLKKFFKESTLLNQQFVRDNKKTVKDFLKESDGDLTVTEFKRIQLNA